MALTITQQVMRSTETAHTAKLTHGRSAPCPSRRDPGERVYLIVSVRPGEFR
jgi:hypothetical protein